MAKEQRKALLHPGMRHLRRIVGLREHLSALSGLPVETITTEARYHEAARIIEDKHPGKTGPIDLVPHRTINRRLEKLVSDVLAARKRYARLNPDDFAQGNPQVDLNLTFGPSATRQKHHDKSRLGLIIRLTGASILSLDSEKAITDALRAAMLGKPPPGPVKPLNWTTQPGQRRDPHSAKSLLEPAIVYEIADARSVIHLAPYIGTFRGRAPVTIAPEHKAVLAKAKRTTGVRLFNQEYIWSRDPAQHAAMEAINDHLKRHYMPRHVAPGDADAFAGAILTADHATYYAAVVTDGKVHNYALNRNKVEGSPQLDGNERTLLAALMANPPSPSSFKAFHKKDNLSDSIPYTHPLHEALRKSGAPATKLQQQFWLAITRRHAAHLNMAIGLLRRDLPTATQDIVSMMARIKRQGAQFQTIETASQLERPDRHARAYATAPILFQIFDYQTKYRKTIEAIDQAKPIPHIIKTYFAESYGLDIQTRTTQSIARFSEDPKNPQDRKQLAITAECFHRGSPKSPPLTLKETTILAKAISIYCGQASFGHRYRDPDEIATTLGPLNMTRLAHGLRNGKNQITAPSRDVIDTIRWLSHKVDAVLEGSNAPDKLRNTILTDIVFPQGRNQAGLNRLSADWHRSTNRYERSYAAFEAEVRQRQTERVAKEAPAIADSDYYPHIISGPVQIGKVTITPLASAEAYFRESEEMRHCISSYRDDGATGKLLAFSLSSEDGRSTPGYTFEPAKNENDKHKIVLVEHQAANEKLPSGEIIRNQTFPASHGTAIDTLIAQTLANKTLLDDLAAKQTRLVDYVAITQNNDLDATSKQELREFSFKQLAEYLPRDQRDLTPDQWIARCADNFEKHLTAENKILTPQVQAEKAVQPRPAIVHRQTAGMEM